MSDEWPIVQCTDYVDAALRQRLDRGFRRYSFRFCEAKDWERLRLFLRDHWSADHLYVSSPELIRWQQYDETNGRYNFFLAERLDTGEIDACMAFMLTAQFDRSLPVRDLWLGLWLSRPGATAGVGSECMLRMVQAIRPRSISGIGISPSAMKLHPRLGMNVAPMDHHYLLNPEIRDFRLVDLAGRVPAMVPLSDAPARRLRELADDEVRSFRIRNFDPLQHIPIKSFPYMHARYAAHPFYDYRLFAVEDGNEPIGLLVARTVEALGSRAIRLVDYLGDASGWVGMGPALIGLLTESGAEYADLYSAGLAPDAIQASGMIPHGEGDPVVIPNYYEPFEKRNKTLVHIFRMPPGARFRLFKGDSDQDRPNRLVPPTPA